MFIFKLKVKFSYRKVNQIPAFQSPCQARKELPVDIIYTDIKGLMQFKKRLKAGYYKFRYTSSHACICTNRYICISTHTDTKTLANSYRHIH